MNKVFGPYLGGQLNPNKCKLAQPRAHLLGHVVSQNGIEADPDKVKALVLMEPPKSATGHISQTCWRVVKKAGGAVIIQDPQGQGPAGMSKLQRKRVAQKASRTRPSTVVTLRVEASNACSSNISEYQGDGLVLEGQSLSSSGHKSRDVFKQRTKTKLLPDCRRLVVCITRMRSYARGSMHAKWREYRGGGSREWARWIRLRHQ
ncbi:hypothetical protein GOP47_0019736 [Adiantum capillus-veneris]|uniref:Uncharacterized protein n=1 Tax=Adiantum capillus-veneris TaxID=13818 RepID=A0A9D4UDB1_ADICA|nr:hypothetical protein GOP47_0019736 [Adiantum capillus-veneris]